ncbi:hypothetical protein [Microbispora sp. H10949]|uniref:hypothetical protein n=1 Tax=Microbispora sp. H10949 TaxID=2729111 RepID=UPI0015FFA7AD|nr:hypothetical protein [Microbispora sp. H10949]
MAKLDGMDPKLVRELLSQVQHAANQMGTIEARVTQLTRNAGVSVHVTHRPSQVADACSTMVKDVTGRLELLEKKEKQSTGKAPTVNGTTYTQEKDITAPADDPAPKSDSQGDKADHKADQKADSKADHKPAPKHGTAGGGAESTATQPGDRQVHDKEHSVRNSPAGHGSGDSGAAGRGESSHQVHSASDGAPRSATDGGGSAGAKHAEKTHGTATGELPQMRPAQDAAQITHPVQPVDVSDTGDSGPGQTQGQGHGQATSEGSRQGQQPGVRDDSQIIDTPGIDHPDDVDQRAGRQEMTVDGTRVVSTPLNQPDAGSATTHAQQTANGSGPHPNGAPGYVNPLEPSHQTADQPSHTGLAPGDPDGDYVGTPADNATEDPYAAGTATSVPGTPDSHGTATTHTASTGQTATYNSATSYTDSGSGSGATHGTTTASLEMNRADNGPAGTGTATGTAGGTGTGTGTGGLADHSGTGTATGTASGTGTGTGGLADHPGTGSGHTGSGHTGTGHTGTGGGATNGTTASVAMDGVERGHTGTGSGHSGAANGTATGTLKDHPNGTATGGLADHPGAGNGTAQSPKQVDITHLDDSAGTSGTTSNFSCTCGAASAGGLGCTCGATHAGHGGTGGHGAPGGHGAAGWPGGGAQGETGDCGPADGHGTHGAGGHGAGGHGAGGHGAGGHGANGHGAGGNGAGGHGTHGADGHGTAGGHGAGGQGAGNGQGWGGHGATGGDGTGSGVTGTDRDGAAGRTGDGDGYSWPDPRAVAATQPGDVLTYPARHMHDDAALQMLTDHHRDIAPHDMPDVRVPEGEWGEGDWSARKIQPDGPPGRVEAVDPGPPTPEN